ncbi:hypothetical protein BH09MYX1_BH09MYX1_00650 [soil metagenome]
MTRNARTTRLSTVRVAKNGSPSVALDRAQKVLLADALRAGAGVPGEGPEKVVEFGRFLLANVFAHDVSAALERKSKNLIWVELLRHTEGPAPRFNRRMLYVALTIAAWDEQLRNTAFHSLDLARKVLLLPLADEKKLKNAASHVAKLDLTQADTRDYVTQLLAQAGKSRQVRITGKGLAVRAMKLRKSLEGPSLRRLRSLEMKPADRKVAISEMERLEAVVAQVVKALKARG